MKTSSKIAARAGTVHADCKLQAKYTEGQLIGLQVIEGSLPDKTIGDVYAQYLSKHQTVCVGDHFKATGPNAESLACEITRVTSGSRTPEVEISINGLIKQLPGSTIEETTPSPRSEFADQLLISLVSLRSSYELRSWESEAIEELTKFINELADQHGRSFDSLLMFAGCGPWLT